MNTYVEINLTDAEYHHAHRTLEDEYSHSNRLASIIICDDINPEDDELRLKHKECNAIYQRHFGHQENGDFVNNVLMQIHTEKLKILLMQYSCNISFVIKM